MATGIQTTVDGDLTTIVRTRDTEEDPQVEHEVLLARVNTVTHELLYIGVVDGGMLHSSSDVDALEGALEALLPGQAAGLVADLHATC